MSNKITDHDDQVMLTKESYESTSVSVNESTDIDNPTPCLFLQCLCKLKGLSLEKRWEKPMTDGEQIARVCGKCTTIKEVE